MLIEQTLEGQINRVEIAIERLRQFEPPEGYYLAFSGGRDSQCIYELAKMSGVKFDAHFNFTTVDPPEVLRFIKENYPDVIWHRPEHSMFQLIPKKLMPPSRMVRYCCEYLKERGGGGRFVVTGVRRSESFKRSKRGLISFCKDKSKTIINPIIDWQDKDVWDFIKQRELKYCCLYDEGQKRIGCILCPLETKAMKIRDIKRYPKFYNAYLLAFKNMLKERELKGKTTQWQTAEDVMNWWVYGSEANETNDKLFEEEQIFNYE